MRRFAPFAIAALVACGAGTLFGGESTEVTLDGLKSRTPASWKAQKPSSKLRTYQDGYRIAKFIFWLIKQEKPVHFFAAIFVVLSTVSVLSEIPIFITFAETGSVPRLPTAVLGMGLGLLAFLSLACGLILDTVTRGRAEAKRMFYLSVPVRFKSDVQ